MESVARNHGFVDGNKRTAVILLNILVLNSDYSIEPFGEEDIEKAFEDVVVTVADGKMSIDDLASWFKLRLHLVTKKKTPKKAPGLELDERTAGSA